MLKRGESASGMAPQLELLAKAIEGRIDPGSVNISSCAHRGGLDHSFLREAAELMSRQIAGNSRSRPCWPMATAFVLITGHSGGNSGHSTRDRKGSGTRFLGTRPRPSP